MRIGVELLAHGKSEERQRILEWLWPGDFWQRHEELAKDRVHDTGNWFLESDEYKNWATGNGPPSLICPGIRILL
jgi:hypothetical protein